VREQLATVNAQRWGDSGWFCTPTGEPGLYGGQYVYASDAEGPWMTQEQATEQIELLAAAEVSAVRRFSPVEAVPGHEGWMQGYDNKEGEGDWKYVRVTGSEIPDDEAPWTAINAFSADSTEYFAGPGYSETGWVPYGEEPAEPPARAQAEVSAEQREAAAEAVRAEIVDPAVPEVVSRLEQRLPPDLVARLGSDIGRLAESRVVTRTASQMAAAQPIGTEQ